MAAQELRPMGIGDILDVTFRLYRQRFLTFLLIAVVVYVPFALLLASFEPFQVTQGPTFSQEDMMRQAQAPESFPTPRVNVTGFVLQLVGIAVFLMVLIPLCSAALVENISATYLGEDLTAGQSYSRAAPRLLAVLGTQFLVILVLFAGFLLCFVPGVIFYLWFLVVLPVVILEAKAGRVAMGRSKELMRGNLNKGFILAFLLIVLTSIIAWGFRGLTALVPWPHPVVMVFARTLLQAIILPLQTAPWILLYYDLRIRKEAFDLEKLAEALGQPAATGGPATL